MSDETLTLDGMMACSLKLDFGRAVNKRLNNNEIKPMFQLSRTVAKAYLI